MRELLTGLSIVLIVALTAALVAPYLIDWNGQRDFIEARLSQVLGQKVTVGGNIDVKLLPTPSLVLGQTVIGDDESPVRLSIHHLDLQLSTTPLLHGEFDVTQARLVEPTIRVTLAQDRTLPALPDAPAFHANVSLDHIAVTGGTLAIADPLSGRTFALDNLNLDADAASLSGPFKVAGTEGPTGHPTSFRLSTAAARDGRAHVRLVVAGNAEHAALDLDGTLALSAAGRAQQSQSLRQSFEGRVVVTGRLDERDGAPVAWTLTGPLKADPRRAALDGGELRLGGEDKGLTLAASGTADLGESPHIDLDLSAGTLDLDRLAGAPVDPSKPAPPPQLPPLATIEHAILAATPPLPARIDAAIDTATWAGETLSGLAAHVAIGGSGPQPFALKGDGPGGSHLAIDGALSASGFVGKLVFSASNPSRTATWLAAVDPRVPIKARDLPTRDLAAKADVTVADGRVEANNVALAIGRSKLTGTAHLEAPDAGTPKLTAALSAPTLYLDALPDLTGWRRSSRALDLDLHLDVASLQVAAAGQGQLATGPIRLALTKTGRHLALDAFTAENLGGARISAQGTLDPRAAHLALNVDAPKLDAAARLAQQVAGGDLADTFAARAPALAPAKLKLDASWAANAAGALVATGGSLDGTLGATRLHAALTPDADAADVVALSATAEAPDGATLLRQLGVATLPIDKLGAGKIALEAHGKADAPLDTKLTATLGASTAEVAGQFKLLAAPRGGSGTLTFASPDISPLLRSTALAFPDMTATLTAKATSTLAYGIAGLGLTDVQADVAGTRATGTLRLAPEGGDTPSLTGALKLDTASLASVLALALGPEQPAAAQSVWSSLAFGSGLADPPRTALQIESASLHLAEGLDATDASFDLAVSPGVVALKNVAGTLSGGHLTGSANLRRDGDHAGLEATLGLDGVALDLPAARGRLTGKLDLAGSGTSALGLVSSLAGSGEATVADLSVSEADPAALPKLFAEVEGDELSVDADTVARAYADAAKAPLSLGTRHFELSLAGGTLTLTPKGGKAPRTASDTVTSVIDGALDLRQPGLALRVKETLNDLPKGWSGAPPSLVVTWNGPPRVPTRKVDVSAFINAVAARALARETARIETYELDIRERAFFNARLQSERRRAQDKAKAEADAREAEARAKARREAAARVAQEKADQERAAKEKAEGERAERSPGGSPTPPDQQPHVSEPRFSPQQPGAAGDPSAAGRY